jgi:hypothetical protein
MSETILDGEIELCGHEDAVKEIFQLRAIDFSQLVARDDTVIRPVRKSDRPPDEFPL